MIRIMMHIPNRHDATNFYRGTGPLGALRKRSDVQFDLVFADEISFGKVHTYDIAFFQRPATASELEGIRIFKRLGVPVIADYDDFLFEVPSDNPAHRAYMNKETRELIAKIIAEATCVWTSTRELKRLLQKAPAPLNQRVYAIPNALDDVHLIRPPKSHPPKKRNPTALWRGSATHQRDVMDYSVEIAEVAAKHPQWSFIFAGWNPWFLTERMAPKQAIVADALPIGEFMDFIYATAPAIGMVPLADSRFNRCKSNIAWLEMTWAGAACLVPDWEEWRNPGAIGYSTETEFQAGLLELIEMGDDQRARLNEESWQHIRNNFMLSSVNGIRESTILACLGKAPWPDGWQELDEHMMELE